MSARLRDWLLRTFIGLALCAAPPFRPVHAEPYVAAFAGGSFPQAETVDLHTNLFASLRVSGPEGGQLTISFDDKSSFRVPEPERSFVVGGKFGYFFDATLLGGNPGLEIESFFFQPDLDNAMGRVSGTLFFQGTRKLEQSVTISRSDFDATVISGNLLYRRVFAKSPRFPAGRWQLYGGPGLGLAIARLRNTTTLSFEREVENTDVAPAYQALGGAKLFLTKRIAIFGEYRFVQTGDFEFRSEHDEPIFSTIGMENISFETDLAAHQVYGGVAFHFH